MRKPIRRRPSPAIVISLLALVFSMAGTATAARVLITSSKQIKAGSVTGSDIKDSSVAARDLRRNAVDSGKVKNGSLTTDDFESSLRQSLQRTQTTALEAFRKLGPQGIEPDKPTRIATLSNIPAGTYALFAKTVITPTEAVGGLLGQGKPVGGHCVLDAGGDKDEARAQLSTPGALAPGVLNMQITRSYGGVGTATLECDTTNAKWNATDTSIIAIRVGSSPRSPVDG